jgi:hypothetical protein
MIRPALCAIGASLLLAAPAGASTYTPTTFLDEGTLVPGDCPPDAVADDCSFREAVMAANDTEDDGDVIVLAAGRYELNSNEADPANPVEIANESSGGTLLIRGAGARQTTIDANASEQDESRALTFAQNSDAELRDAAVTGGLVTGLSNGGAIKVRDSSDAEVLFTRVWLHGNHAGGDGGSISNRGKLTLVQSLVSGNTADGSGGGIENDDELTLINTTVSGNQAQGDQPLNSLSRQSEDDEGNGGGIDNDGDDREDDDVAGLAPGGAVAETEIPQEAPFLRAVNSTIAFNTAAGNGGGVSTAVADEENCEVTLAACDALAAVEGGPVARFQNTIVSDNSADGEDNCSGNQDADAGVYASSEGNNLEDGETCLFTAEGDQNAASGLAALADNGGGTDTHKLNDGSAAIDKALESACPAVDQRGTARPQRNGCDVGAFEREPATVQQEDPPVQQQQQQQPQPQGGQPEQTAPQCLDTAAPLTSFARSGLKVTSSAVTLKGTSQDQGAPCASGLQRVEVSLAKVSGTELNCRFIRRSNRFVLSPFRNCRSPILFRAAGTSSWSFKFKAKLAPGKYRAQARAYDAVRNKETPKKRQNIVTFTVK